MELLPKFNVNEYNGQPVSTRRTKHDGHYCEVYKSESIPGDHIAVLFKKQNLNVWNKIKHHAEIHDQLVSLPMETILRGELHGKSYHATSVPTMLNNAHPHLLFSPFKIEMWDGEPGPYPFATEDRWLKAHGFTIHESETYFGSFVKLGAKDIEKTKQEALDNNVEGYVVMDFPGGKYWKIKPEKSVDAFITGYHISDSDAFYGGLKSVDIAVYDGDKIVSLGTCGAGAGNLSEIRMTVDPETLIGRVAEFGYQCLASQGKLKFPKFLRWRDDEKTPKECDSDQIAGC